MGDESNNAVENSNEYYRELLSRVDDAIVETRNNAAYNDDYDEDYSLDHFWSYAQSFCSQVGKYILMGLGFIYEVCICIFVMIQVTFEQYCGGGEDDNQYVHGR